MAQGAGVALLALGAVTGIVVLTRPESEIPPGPEPGIDSFTILRVENVNTGEEALVGGSNMLEIRNGQDLRVDMSLYHIGPSQTFNYELRLIREGQSGADQVATFSDSVIETDIWLLHQAWIHVLLTDLEFDSHYTLRLKLYNYDGVNAETVDFPAARLFVPPEDEPPPDPEPEDDPEDVYNPPLPVSGQGTFMTWTGFHVSYTSPWFDKRKGVLEEDHGTSTATHQLPWWFRPETVADVVAQVAPEEMAVRYRVAAAYLAVRDNITYMYDRDRYGVSDYWQLPRETWDLKTGDCEDHAILVVNMLANIISPDKVFFVLGDIAGGGYHAWCVARMSFGDYVMDAVWKSVAPFWDSTLVEYHGNEAFDYYLMNRFFHVYP